VRTGWTTTTLGEIAQVVTGSTPSTSAAANFDGPYPFVTPSELDSIEPIRRSKTSLSEIGAQQSRVLPASSVLICCIGSLGKVGIAGVPLVTNQQINALILDDRYVLPKYAFHYCRTLQPMMEHVAPSTTLKIINKSRFSAFKIAFPPLAEQRRIAAILDKAEALRAKRRETLSRSASLASTLFRQMFGDPIANEKGWRSTRIADFVAGFEGGKSLVSEDEDDHTTLNRVLKVSAVTSLRYRPEEAKPVPDAYQPPSQHFVRQGDLLFSRANTSELVGATAFVFKSPSNVLLPDKLWRFVWRESCPVDPLFVWYLFQHESFRREIGKRATGTSGSMKNISQAKLMLIETALPPLENQRAFGNFVRSMEQLSQHQNASVSEIERLFVSLQNRAFRGEL
jgi:type I restriction enzyme, S subunit